MYAKRERLEQIEVDTLAPYALFSRDTRGRFHHDHEPEYRTSRFDWNRGLLTCI